MKNQDFVRQWSWPILAAFALLAASPFIVCGILIVLIGIAAAVVSGVVSAAIALIWAVAALALVILDLLKELALAFLRWADPARQSDPYK